MESHAEEHEECPDNSSCNERHQSHRVDRVKREIELVFWAPTTPDQPATTCPMTTVQSRSNQRKCREVECFPPDKGQRRSKPQGD